MAMACTYYWQPILGYHLCEEGGRSYAPPGTYFRPAEVHKERRVWSPSSRTLSLPECSAPPSALKQLHASPCCYSLVDTVV
eukprot:1161703-Pelagomonas_calceolata.AAC.8